LEKCFFVFSKEGKIKNKKQKIKNRKYDENTLRFSNGK